MHADLPMSELSGYRSEQVRPADFDSFWKETLDDAAGHDVDVRLREVRTPLRTIITHEVLFRGFGGQDVHAWLRAPSGVDGPLPAVVQYAGYGDGRGHELECLLWASAGYAHLQMDTRGQGGSTPDVATTWPQVPGMLTRGILDPAEYYYRRLFTDAVRAVDAAHAIDRIDPARVAVVGGSQGGGMALAVAGLRSDLAAVVAFVPFLCDFPRATTITDAHPYREVADYLAVHRGHADRVHRTLSYFDGVNFAAQATAPALFSAGLMDVICPPSTVYAAFNVYEGQREMMVWEYNGHEGGGIFDEAGALGFLASKPAVAG